MPDKLKDMLDRATIFAKADFEQDEKVSLTLKKGKLHVQAKGSAGWFKERTKIEYDGDAVTFTVRPKFLSETLGLLQEMIVGDGRLKLEAEKFIHIVCLISEKEG